MGFVKIEKGGGLVAKIDARAVGKALTRFPREMAEESARAFRRGGIHWEREMKTKQFTGYSGESQPGKLQNRTGNLRRSIQYRMQGTTLSTLWLILQAGDNRAAYAVAQERGAVIKAKPGGALTIPLSGALTASGALRGSAIIRREGGKYVTDLGPTQIIRAPNGQPYIAVRTQQGKKKGIPGKLVFLYVLKKSVTIPGPDTTGEPSRLGAERRARMMITEVLVDELNEAAVRAWEKGSAKA